MTETAAPNRLDRRKARTRAALVTAARELLASRDQAEVSIQEITDAADVGFGSFYNHFESKADLFDAALEDVLEEHGALFDALTADMDDPAEVYASSVRMTVRMAKTHPQIAKIIQRTGLKYLSAPDGLAPRALRDLQRARDAGRFQIGDPKVAVASSGGAVLGVLALTTTNPKPKPSTPPPTSLRPTCCACSACPTTRLARSPAGHYPSPRKRSTTDSPRCAGWPAPVTGRNSTHPMSGSAFR